MRTCGVAPRGTDKGGMSMISENSTENVGRRRHWLMAIAPGGPFARWDTQAVERLSRVGRGGTSAAFAYAAFLMTDDAEMKSESFPIQRLILSSAVIDTIFPTGSTMVRMSSITASGSIS